ncbi:MAG: secondary thiamine-phosphate synthase enzyme YjbQ [Planctomycetota bacterium]
MQRFTVRTKRRAELVDVTRMVEEAALASGAGEGLVTVFVPHTTAGVTINENADPSVCRDILARLERLAPLGEREYTHAEGNSDAHIKASLVGSSVQVMLEGGRLALGAWQGVYLAEFDGPRAREVWVRVV